MEEPKGCVSVGVCVSVCVCISGRLPGKRVSPETCARPEPLEERGRGQKSRELRGKDVRSVVTGDGAQGSGMGFLMQRAFGG